MRPQISSAILLRIMRSVWIGSFADGKFGPPHEKCGILRGRDNRILRADFTDNVSPTPEVAFEIQPAQLLAAYRAQRGARALCIQGFFHTHLSDDPTPSLRDAECAAPDGMLWLITTSTQARLWRAVAQGEVHGRFDPVQFDLLIGKRLVTGLFDVRHVDHGREYHVDLGDPAT